MRTLSASEDRLHRTCGVKLQTSMRNPTRLDCLLVLCALPECQELARKLKTLESHLPIWGLLDTA